MLRCICLVFCLTQVIPSVTSAQETGAFATRSIDEIELEAATRRDELLSAIIATDRTTRRIAVAELRGGFDGDPAVTESLLKLMAAEAGPAPPPQPLLTEARINVLFLLAKSSDDAWIPETVDRALALAGMYGSAGHFVAGPLEAGLLKELETRLASLSGTRASFGEIQGRVESKFQFTDIDVFVCTGWLDDEVLVRETRAFAEALAQDEFGRVRLRQSTPELEIQLSPEQGQTTIYVDIGHPEVSESEKIAKILSSFDLPPITRSPNIGSPSFWYVSAFVCP